MNAMSVNLALLLSLPLQSSSFSPAARIALANNGVPGSVTIRPTAAISSGSSRSWSSSPLTAKKRRRRKAAPPTSTTTAPSDELPDFDDDEEDSAEREPAVESGSPGDVVASASSPPANAAPIKRGSGLNAQLAEEVGGNVDGLDEDVILGAMRGKSGESWQPPRSIQDTLSDRRLEKFMDFDRMVERDGGGGDAVELPDFDDVISRRKQREAMQEGQVEDAVRMIDTAGMGKKAARNAERKAAAMQREAEADAEKSPFEDLNILKLLENGAWVGIGLLVVWEIYINSPFFERAAPLIPVVYDEVKPPGM